jgi:hypothetical protein
VVLADDQTVTPARRSAGCPGRRDDSIIFSTLSSGNIDLPQGAVQTLAVGNQAHRELAGWLLVREIGDRDGLDAEVEAAELVCRKLSRRLGKLVTPAGCQAVLARGLHLARAEFPFLDGVRVGVLPEVCLEGLGESTAGVEPVQARAAIALALASVVGLLATFIGDELTLRLVRDVWPDARLGETDPGTQEAQA